MRHTHASSIGGPRPLQEGSRTAQYRVRIDRIMLKDNLGPPRHPDIGRLARPTISNEPDRPGVLITVGQNVSHRSCMGSAGLRMSNEPGITNTRDGLGRTGE